MTKRIFTILVAVTGLFVAAARADVMVLVHGYLSGAQSWDASGISALLERNGWQRGGMYVTDPAGMHLVPARGRPGERIFYTVDLPSEAPILIQSFHLRRILRAIDAGHPGEPLTLVGHSAGGIVARAALLRDDIGSVQALITIASPHLGTVRAEQALDVTDIPFPFSLVTDFFGGEIYDTARRSRSLFVDLVRPRPGSLLFWLNSQPHPDIEYVSIVRGQPAVLTGDYVVPGYSQDMNNVPALRGISSLVTVNSTHHGLSVLDGSAIVSVQAGQH
jgi:pimeloyl-ACP methyl ester carboxylesterase